MCVDVDRAQPPLAYPCGAVGLLADLCGEAVCLEVGPHSRRSALDSIEDEVEGGEHALEPHGVLRVGCVRSAEKGGGEKDLGHLAELGRANVFWRRNLGSGQLLHLISPTRGVTVSTVMTTRVVVGCSLRRR